MKIQVLDTLDGTLVSIAEARFQVGLAGSDTSQDVPLQSKLISAIESAERYTRMRVRRQRVLFTFDQFPTEFPVYPIAEIESIKYDGEDAADQTLALENIHQDLSGMYPRICPTEDWPALMDGKPGAVRITAIVGAESIPEDYKAAVLLRTKELFAMRGESIIGGAVSASELTFESLLQPFVRY